MMAERKAMVSGFREMILSIRQYTGILEGGRKEETTHSVSHLSSQSQRTDRLARKRKKRPSRRLTDGSSWQTKGLCRKAKMKLYTGEEPRSEQRDRMGVEEWFLSLSLLLSLLSSMLLR